MSRILNYIAKYDENLTITQLREAIKQEEISAKQKETEEIDKVKKDFSNTYLKKLDEHPLFGKTLNIYHLKNYVRSERTTDWSLIYYFEGSKTSFSERDIHRGDFNPDICGNSFSAEELRGMTKISSYEYKKYKAKYSELTNELKNLMM